MDYISVPLAPESGQADLSMQIGYIDRKNHMHTPLGLAYVEEMKKYLNVT